MPPKTVRCCICGEEVMKSQTYAIDNKGNRACKSHEGVAEKKGRFRVQEKGIQGVRC